MIARGKTHKWLPSLLLPLFRQFGTACGITTYVKTASRWSRVTCKACLEKRQ